MKDKNTNVSTSQPSIEYVKEEWREILKEYDEKTFVIENKNGRFTFEKEKTALIEPLIRF